MMGRVDRGDVRGESRNHHVHSLVSIYGLVVILLVVGVWGGGGSWPVMGEKEEVVFNLAQTYLIHGGLLVDEIYWSKEALL
jgi:hypothetical protein